MGFAIAEMSYLTRECTVFHNKYVECKETPWTVSVVPCPDHTTHVFDKGLWKFQDYNPSQSGVYATLKLQLLDLNNPVQLELHELFLRNSIQLAITVKFKNLKTASLSLNLKP